MRRHVLTLSCPDRPGIVHAVTAGILAVDGNILENAQFSDPDTGLFCMRTVIATEAAADEVATAVGGHLGDEAAGMRVRPAEHRPRVLILVSKFDHCLVDLLYRWRNDALDVEVAAIVSNHPDCAPIAEQHDVPFFHLPVTRDTKPEQEARLREIIDEFQVDLVVLARYMQVLSDELCAHLEGRAINIHHSFLPGFKGAKPYHQAWDRGVKLTGATAHFVTADLDEGPIISQDVEAVSHRHTPEQMVARGRDVERRVLSAAVTAFAEDRIFLLDNSRTVVFE